MAMNIKLGATALAGLGLVACAPVAHNYAEATAYNKVAQVVNPTPVYDENGAQPGDNGERATGAVEAYREGEVKQPAGGAGRNGQRGGSGLGGLGAAGGPR